MFLHTYHPYPILLDLGIIKIHWYGFLIALGIIIGFLIFYKIATRIGFKKEFIFNLSFWLIIWAIIGGRLYHILSEIGYYIYHPFEMFFIWRGGFGIFGAIITGIVVVFFFSKKISTNQFNQFNQRAIINKTLIEGIGLIKTDKKNYWLLVTGYWLLFFLDLLSPLLALGQSLGRWGNYFNQELYGKPSNLPWSIPIDLEKRLIGYENFEYFHPVFLYESAFCFLVFLILISIIIKCYCKDKSMPCFYNGYIFISYILLYSTWRFLIEFIRIDIQPVWLNLRLGQWVSFLLIIFSIALYFILKKWHNKVTEIGKNSYLKILAKTKGTWQES